MKKKLVYLFSILFACVMSIGLFIFVLSGDNNQSNEKLLGKWRIVGSFNQGSFEYNLDEFVTFKEDNVTYCKEDNCIDDNYKVSSTNEIELFEHRYHINYKIDEVIKLYIADDTYLILLRWNDDYNIDEKYSIEGKWSVIYKDTYVNNMELEFKEGNLIQTIDDKTNSYQYEIKENNISVNDGQLNFICIPIKENEMVFIDTTYGTVWGLSK